MAVKEIPIETQKDVDLNVIKKAMYESMTNFYGKHDLSWIDCLFDYGLRDHLEVKKGMIHYFNSKGIDEVEKILHQNRVYGCSGDPKALLYTEKLPKEFNLFIIGPEYNNKNLEIVCSSPEINLRDIEEERVIQEINSKVEESIKGKHKNVESRIYLVGPTTNPLKGINLYKKWKMPVEPSFLFNEDIKDIINFSQIYSGFFEYQKQRDKSFKNTAEKIIGEVLDKES